jgi:PEP-CTERM motif
MNARTIVSLAGVIAALFAGGSFVAGAHAAETIPGATGEASASGFLTSPSTFDESDTAATSIYGVPLSTYGEMGSYAVTTIKTGFPVTVTNPNTPGVVGSEGVSAADVTMNRTYPSLNVVGDYGCCSGGEASGTLVYYFEVVNSSSPGSVSPVTIGVTASGGVSGSATGVPNPVEYGVSILAQAELLITAGPGSSVVDELAQTNAGYTVLGGVGTGNLNSTTSNVTVNFGATTTFSGGFSLNDDPITINTDTVYEVEMYAAIGGDPIIDERAYIDPFIGTPSGYSLELSPGILNGTAPIPEPSTWVMMLAGFAGLGALGFRRARKVALADGELGRT